jgi:hypothetical protein
MYTRFFIACDIVSLSLQGAGGGVASAATTDSTMALGNKLMLVGLIFQIVTLAIFCADFAFRVYKFQSGEDVVFNRLVSTGRFKGFLGAVFVAFLTIFTRCVYRVIELGGGWNNPLMREEVTFIILESW